MQARDAAGNWSSAQAVTFDVTDLDDTAPVVTVGQSYGYAENRTAGQVLATVVATDAVGVTGFRFANGTLTSDDGSFAIDGTTGAITLTATGLASAANDFETTPNGFTLSVQARDAAGNWSAAADVTLAVTDVDDTAPAVTAGQAFSYAENRTAGQVLGTVAAGDAVGVTGFRFAATGGSISADGYFQVAANGDITLTAAGLAAASASNDYETTPNAFTHSVQARDAAGNWSAAEAVTLTVTDLDDTAPVVTGGQSFSYAENRTAGQVIATVAATDAVGVAGYQFAATGTAVSSDGYFQVAANGALTLTAAGLASSANDFETTPNSYTHAVRAVDAAGNLSAAVDVTLDVTDLDDTAPAVTAGQAFSYAENRTAGQVVATVAATDAVGVTGFRFANGTLLSDDGSFAIDGTTGAITLTATGLASAANDFETTPNSFTLSMQARDAAGNWSAARAVTFNVTDLDDTAPVVTAGQGYGYAE
ncbi:MAG: cadherin repeat domain-containing protein, partial [Comamonadaceae bacterium]